MENHYGFFNSQTVDLTITLKILNEYRIIHVNKILFCKADGSYSELYMDDSSVVIISKSLAALERKLGNTSFIRCHNSYLINARKVEKFDRKKKNLTIGGYKIPVSRRKCSKTMPKLLSLNDRL
jgi:two-component system LytT family response regulator